jgi:hypothetical protein
MLRPITCQCVGVWISTGFPRKQVNRWPHARGGIQNIPDWWRHLYSSCGSAKHRPQQKKLRILGSTATFYGDCVKTCKDVAPNFGQNRPGCFTMTTPCITLPSSPSSFWRKTQQLASSPTVLPWFGTLWLLPFSKLEIEDGRSPVWYNWGDPSRIAECAWHSDRKGLSGSVPKMEKTVGPVSTCGRNYFEGDGGR